MHRQQAKKCMINLGSKNIVLLMFIGKWGNLYKTISMNDNQLTDKLQQIFSKVFNDNDLRIDPATTMDEIDQWDSLHNVMLIDEIEKAFNIQFELDELLQIDGVSSILGLIKSKIE